LEQNNKLFNCRINETGKYGRYLVNLFVDNQCIKKIMVDSTHAIEYDGGTKKYSQKTGFKNLGQIYIHVLIKYDFNVK